MMEDFGCESMNSAEEFACLLEGLANSVREGTSGPVALASGLDENLMVSGYTGEDSPLLLMELIAKSQLYTAQLLLEMQAEAEAGEEDDDE